MSDIKTPFDWNRKQLTFQVLEIAELIGYGHLIAILRAEWRDRLIKQGLSHQTADEATNVCAYDATKTV